MATKTSILVFYLRLARNTKKSLRIASYVTLAVVNVAGVVLTLLNVFQCSPVAAVFGAADGECIALVTLYLASAPVNVITDLAILILPIPILTGMHLPQKQKTFLVAAFGLGVFVTVVDVVRIFYLQQASTDKGNGLAPSAVPMIGDQANFAWFASLSLMWSAVEVNVGIICACIPTLKPLITHFLPKLIFDHTQDERSRSGSSKRRALEAQDQDQSIELTSAKAEPFEGEGVIRPLPPPRLGADREQEMGLMTFLTTPCMNLQEKKRIENSTKRPSQSRVNRVHFGFVNIGKPKSMLKTRGRESFGYCIMVTLLVFLWGFSYGLLSELNSQISTISQSDSEEQSLCLQAAYFTAYFFGPLTVGQYVLRKGGFKACFITGLFIYGTGTLMFWPSGVLTSFPGFIVSNFVVGFGLSVLETAANPFIALCGPLDYAEMRLLLAQGMQAIGSLVSPLLAQKVLFAKVTDEPSLIDVQWTYLAVALFSVMLAIFFYYTPLPEASDEDLDHQSQSNIEKSDLPQQKHFFYGFRIIYITLAIGVMSQWFYVGIQECLSVFVGQLITSVAPDGSSLTLTPFNCIIIGRTVFGVSRVLAAILCLVVKPRHILLFTYLGMLLFSIFIMLPFSRDPTTVAAMAVLLFFFEGPGWPLIFAISLRNLGRKTKIGSACITAGGSAGAALPWIMYAVQSVGSGLSVQYSFCVLVALAAGGMLFPIYLDVLPGARAQVDPSKNRFRRCQRGHNSGFVEHEEIPETPPERIGTVTWVHVGSDAKHRK